MKGVRGKRNLSAVPRLAYINLIVLALQLKSHGQCIFLYLQLWCETVSKRNGNVHEKLSPIEIRRQEVRSYDTFALKYSFSIFLSATISRFSSTPYAGI